MEIKLKNNKKIIIEGKDVMSVLLKANNLLIKEIVNNNIIEALLIEDEYALSLKDKVEVEYISKSGECYKTFYIINEFKKDKDDYRLIEFQENDENIFLMPAILSHGTSEQYSINRYFVNSFLDKDNEEILYLQYRFFNFESYENLDLFLKSRLNFLKVIPNGRFNIYTFKLSMDNIYNANCYVEGRYGDMEFKYKDKIVRLNGLKKGNDIYDLFYNTQSLRDKLSISLGVEIPKEIQPRSKPKLNILNYGK